MPLDIPLAMLKLDTTLVDLLKLYITQVGHGIRAALLSATLLEVDTVLMASLNGTNLLDKML